MRVSFVTTNPVKITSMKRVLESRGIEVEIIDHDIPEIQAHTAVEVASEKARQAYRLHGRPVLVNDFAFHIDALGGWPGALVKLATERPGLGAFFRMLRTDSGHLGYASRMVNAVAYHDVRLKEPKVFTREIAGIITPDVYDALPKKEGAWVDKVFVPDGETIALGQMTQAQFERWRRGGAVEGYYRELADWLIAHERETAGKTPISDPTG